jgi:sugar phosphate isomerase/epimerase
MANSVWLGRDPVTEVHTLGSLVRRVHVKDARIEGGDCALGQGRVDFGETAKALREIGYDGWLVGEFWGYRDSPPTLPRAPELAARDVSFTRFWFPELDGVPAWPRLGALSKHFRRDELSVMIESFKDCGLTTVQLGWDILNAALEQPDRAPAIRAELEENGIVVSALGGYQSLVARDPYVRRANIEYLKACLEIAPQFGTSVVATETGTRHPDGRGFPSHENRSKDAWELLCAGLDELLAVAERHRTILALEGYVNHMLANESQVIRLLDRYPTDRLQLVLDPYNYMSSQLLPAGERILGQFLNRFERRFVLAHVKDVSAGGAEAGTPEFGLGVFPHDKYLDFLRTRRPDLPIILDDLPRAHIRVAAERVRSRVRGQ